MGKEVSNGGCWNEETTSWFRQNKKIKKGCKMGNSDNESNAENVSTHTAFKLEWLGATLQFGNEQHQIAFEDLSNEHKDRVAAIVKHKNNSQKAAEELGVSWRSFDTALGKIFREKFNATKLEVFPGFRIRNKHKPKSLATELMELIKKQEFRCALTGVRISPKDAVVDHIVAVVNGGEHLIENLQWVHKEVNRMKGSMEQTEFISICRKVAQWTA